MSRKRLNAFILHNFYFKSHITNVNSRSVGGSSGFTVYLLKISTADLHFILQRAQNNTAYTHKDILQCLPQNIGAKTLGVCAHFGFQIYDNLVTITLNMILNKTTQPVITKTNIRGER
jgi:hypothetical protein